MNRLMMKYYELKIKKLDQLIASRGRLYLITTSNPINIPFYDIHLSNIKSKINSLNDQRNSLVNKLIAIQNAN